MDPPTREVGPTPGTGLGHMLDPLIHLGHPVPSPVVVPVALLPRTTGLLLLGPSAWPGVRPVRRGGRLAPQVGVLVLECCHLLPQ
jgi:hypothetical protein